MPLEPKTGGFSSGVLWQGSIECLCYCLPTDVPATSHFLPTEPPPRFPSASPVSTRPSKRPAPASAATAARSESTACEPGCAAPCAICAGSMSRTPGLRHSCPGLRHSCRGPRHSCPGLRHSCPVPHPFRRVARRKCQSPRELVADSVGIVPPPRSSRPGARFFRPIRHRFGRGARPFLSLPCHSGPPRNRFFPPRAGVLRHSVGLFQRNVEPVEHDGRFDWAWKPTGGRRAAVHCAIGRIPSM